MTSSKLHYVNYVDNCPYVIIQAGFNQMTTNNEAKQFLVMQEVVDIYIKRPNYNYFKERTFEGEF